MNESFRTGMVSENVDRRMAEVVAEITDRLQAGEAVDVAAYLARYPELADRLRPLLASLALLDQFRSSVGSDRPPGRTAAELCGTLGDFRLIQEVGKGGMGVVYEAEQVSLGRRVALKVLPFAATMDARQLQRFHNEARAAACLHHTNIVPVFSVGCEQGVHFYAMQYIDGQPLSELIRQMHERENKTPTAGGGEPNAAVSTPLPAAEITPLTGEGRRGRDYYRRVAELGVQAAEALDHAHQLGIVHRDIKPANLLVDNRGNVWVTDFGLAQMQQSDASLTATGQVLGTPRYMSPEQALAKRVPIDHRTDVYSLGATLYELLTLRPAFTSEDRQELLRQIVFEEPTRLRRFDPAVPAELEIIVLKAMEKWPQDRYSTAQQLADDLRRFLDDKPIQARRPTLLERARKLSRRHHTAVRVALVGLLLTFAGLAFSTALIWKEKEQKERAYQAEAEQRRRAEKHLRQACNAVDEMLSQVGQDRLQGIPRMEEVRRELLTKALNFYRLFLEESGNDQALRIETAKAYLRLGEIDFLLDRNPEAENDFAQSISLFQTLVAENPTEPMFQQFLARSYLGLGKVLGEKMDRPDPDRSYRKGTAILRDLLANCPEESSYSLDLALTLVFLGRAYQYGRFSDPGKYYLPDRAHLAEDSYREAGALLEKLVSASPDAFEPRAALGELYGNLGDLLRHTNRYSEAEQIYSRNMSIRRKLAEDFPDIPWARFHLADAYANMGMILQQTGRLPEAAQNYRSALDVTKALASDFPKVHMYHHRQALIHSRLGEILANCHEVAEAAEHFRQAIAIFATPGTSTSTNDNHELGASHAGLARILAGSDDTTAEKHYRLAIDLHGDFVTRYHLPGHHTKQGDILKDFAVLLHRRGNISESRQLLERAIEQYQEELKRRKTDPTALNNLAWLLTTTPFPDLRDIGQAVELAKKAVERSPQNGSTWTTLGLAQYRAADWPSAVVTLEKSIQLRQGGDSKDWFFLAMAHWQLGEEEKSREWYAKAVQWMDKYRPQDEELCRFREEATTLLASKETSTRKGQDATPKKD